MSDEERNKKTTWEMMRDESKPFIAGIAVGIIAILALALATLLGWMLIAPITCLIIEGLGFTTIMECLWSHERTGLGGEL